MTLLEAISFVVAVNATTDNRSPWMRVQNDDTEVTGQSRMMTLHVQMSACCTDCVYTSIRSKHNASQTTFRCGLADPRFFLPHPSSARLGSILLYCFYSDVRTI